MKKSIFLLALVGVVLFTHLETFFMPVGTDEGMFYHIGQQIMQGALPYRDVWEHKPPVAFYIFAAVLKVSNTNAALIALECFWVFLTAYFLYLLARFFLKEKKAQYAALLYAFCANVHRFAQGGNHTEVYMVLFTILLYYSFLRFRSSLRYRWLFFSGMFWGIAFQTKPVAVFSGLAVAVFFTYEMFCDKHWQQWFKSCLFYALGFLFPNILLLGYFAFAGILPSFLELNYGYNTMYVTKNYLSAERLTWLLDTGIDNLISIPFLWFLAAYALTFRGFLREWRTLFLVIIALFDFCGVCLGGKFHGHYWIQLMPSFSILALAIYQQVKIGRVKKIFWTLLVLAIIGHGLFTLKAVYKHYTVPDQDKITGYYLKARTTRADRIYVQGITPEIYFHANRLPVWNAETDNILKRVNAKKLKQYELYFKSHKPKYIVVTMDYFFPWQKAFIKNNYHFVRKIGTYEIYLRR